MSKSDDAITTMSGLIADFPGFSRRQLLRGAAIVAGSTTALLATTLPAQAKMPPKAAAYQDAPKGDQSCTNCSLFKPPSSCILVDGTISPNGWCRFYAKKS